jgi:hypothetical protein
MHNLGDSFGFRRSDEILWSGAEGGFKTPVGVTLLQGDMVEIDPASPGYLKKSLTNLPLVPGVRGLLVQYDQLFVESGLTRPVIFNTRDLSTTIEDTYAVIATGAGLKVWVKNLAAVTTGARRHYSAETRCTVASVAVGDLIGWDGSKFVEVTSPITVAIGTVTGEVTASGFTFTLNA